MQKKDENFQYLEGKNINKQEAVQIAKKYASIGDNVKVQVESNGKGSDYGFYSVSLQNKENKLEANMDITKKGGYPIWFILSRDVKNQSISLNDASNRAIEFLKQNGFKNLDLFESAQYDNVGVFTFVNSENNIRVYPDAIRMKVALDNGQLLGFSADDYLKSHHTREIPNPVITKEQAQSKINPNLKIMENRLAVILNDLKKEVLCYEFLGTLGE